MIINEIVQKRKEKREKEKNITKIHNLTIHSLEKFSFVQRYLYFIDTYLFVTDEMIESFLSIRKKSKKERKTSISTKIRYSYSFI